MERKWIFRADANYKEGQNVVCKNPNRKKNVHDHVTQGSKIGTRFISTTAELSVAALKFSHGDIAEKREKRAPIILIDFRKLKALGTQESRYSDEQQIYDFTDEKQIEEHLGEVAHNLARSDREIVVNRLIPAECCKEIPPMMVDILMALRTDIEDSIKGEPRKEELLKVGESMYDSILDMIMQGNTRDLDQIISKMEFNELEKKFISLYYGERMTMGSVAKTMFGDLEQGQFLANAMLTQIIKNIIKTPEFIQATYFEKEVFSKPEVMANSDLYLQKASDARKYQSKLIESYIAPFAWEKVKYSEKTITNYGYKIKTKELIEKSFSNRNKEGKKCGTTAETSLKDKLVLFKTYKIPLAQKAGLRFPSGMEYDIKDNKVISAFPQYVEFGRKN